MKNLYVDSFESPLGLVEINSTAERITSIAFVETAEIPQANDVTRLAIKQLQEYFNHRRQTFELPLSAEGTSFQRQVWQQLTAIPFGQTCSYQDLAERVSNPKAVRAVGSANANNPLAIVVPCHRVIASNGKLSGYAGGVHRKAWLINHEANTLF